MIKDPRQETAGVLFRRTTAVFGGKQPERSSVPAHHASGMAFIRTNNANRPVLAVRGQRGISPWVAAICGIGCEEYRSLAAARDEQPGAGPVY